jgi:hypothetical protein
MAYFDKQHASRVIKSQNLNWTGSGTLVSTNFTTETWHVRVVSQVGGFFAITLPCPDRNSAGQEQDTDRAGWG